MRKELIIAIALILTLGVRLTLLNTANDVSLEGYNTQLYVEHIKETGLPLTHSDLSWKGATSITMPLFYYVLAFFSIFFSMQKTLLFLPNIFMSTIPLLVYLLATQATKNEKAILAATLASTFTPLLYKTTLVSANPLSLATPLLLLTYYYFLRIGKTPRDQTIFAICAILTTATHPISLLLAPAMGLTLLLTHIQKTRFSLEMAEATIFTSFFIIWANSIMYKYSLQHFGLATFWLTNQYTFNLATAGTIVGIIPLLTGGYVAVQAFTQEKNTAIHAITAAILTITAAILLHIIPFETGILLLSIFLIVLLAPAGELLFAARQRSRIPSIHTIAVLVIGLAFIFTNVVPAIALGTEALNSTPKIYDYKAREVLQLTTQKKSIILWDAQHASFLEEKGFQTVIGQSPLQNPKSKEISAAVGNLSIYQTEIQLIRALNTYEVTAIVIPKNSKLPLSERCFEPLYRSEVEVYKLTCVVQ